MLERREITPRNWQRERKKTSSASTTRRKITSRATAETLQRDTKKAKESGEPCVDRKHAAPITSHDHVFAVTESTSLGNHADRWNRLVVLIVITFVQEPVSALQEKRCVLDPR